MIRIYYFSGTGNTRYAAMKLHQKLQASGFSCEVKSIEEITSADATVEMKNCHAVLFGYPIYGSYTCELMVDFLKSVHVPASVKVGFFCTQMMFSGDGARVGHDLLQTEAKTYWGIHINMPNNLNCGACGFLPITNDPGKIRRKYLDKADKEIEKLAHFIISDKSSLTGFSFISRLLGLMQRPGYTKVYKNSWHAAMQIDQQRCTLCGLCYNQCPADNIKMQDDKYVMLDHCVLCLRCYNFCPEMAVTFLGKAHRQNRDRYQGIPDN